MLVLYSIGIRIYGWLVSAAALFKPKAKLFTEGRKQWRKKLAAQLAAVPAENRVWFHCASLGEFEQARPVIEAIKAQYGHPVIVSFFSPSGYELRKQYAHADAVCYLPLDTKQNARDFIALVNPAKAYFVKYEFWYYYLTTLKQKQIPTCLISAVFRDDQVFFKSYGSMFYKLLSVFEIIFVQNDLSLDVLKRHGVHNAFKGGDTRFDRVMQTYKMAESNQLIEQFTDGHSTLLLGSSWPEEETLTASFLTSHPDLALRVIIAPHDISEAHIRQIEETFAAFSPLRYTSLKQAAPQQWPQVLILDTIGQLASSYRYADIAFVGGAFGKGLHNILEPAVFGMPVVFGPAPDKFPEAKAAEEAGFGFRVQSSEELDTVLMKLLQDEPFYETCCKQAHQFIAGQTGATDMVLSRYLKP